MTRQTGRVPGRNGGRRARFVPRVAIATVFLLGILAGALMGVVPHVLAGVYALGSLVAFALYAMDKSAAGAGRRRTPENTLHSVALLGGWPGALAAQQVFRHKTAKASFQWVFCATAIANLVVVAWLMTHGDASAVREIRFWG